MAKVEIKIFYENDHYVAELPPFVGHGPTQAAAIRELMKSAEIEIVPTEPIQLSLFKENQNANTK